MHDTDLSYRWIVRRDHLHAGLEASARQHGVNIVTNCRIASLQETEIGGMNTVTLTSTAGLEYSFDFVVAADGIKSAVRSQLFPDVKPVPYADAVAYRHTAKFSDIFRQVPDAMTILEHNFNMWCGPHGYIVTYPISGGKEMNITICFYTKHGRPTSIVENADLSELHEQLKEYPEIIRKIWSLAPGSHCWPLLHIPKMDRWSNESRSIVLLGDACHAMNPALAQGAATAIEDAAFLGRVLLEFQRGTIQLAEAVTLYEQARIPKAWIKQQLAFVAADIEMGGPGPSYMHDESFEQIQKRRDTCSDHEHEEPQPAMAAERRPPETYRAWHHAFAVEANPRNYYYDAEADADDAVCRYILERSKIVETTRMATDGLERKFWSPLFTSDVVSQH
jgi:salicylate hydroxylase